MKTGIFVLRLVKDYQTVDTEYELFGMEEN